MDARSRYKARTSAAGVGTNVSGITGPIKDVKAEAPGVANTAVSYNTISLLPETQITVTGIGL